MFKSNSTEVWRYPDNVLPSDIKQYLLTYFQELPEIYFEQIVDNYGKTINFHWLYLIALIAAFTLIIVICGVVSCCLKTSVIK